MYDSAMARPSRFTPEEKAHIVLRHLRGESQAALRKEFHVGRSTLKEWKKHFVAAGAARLRKPIESNPTLITRAKALFAELSRELADWQPDL